jgi:hypothetical protein
VGCADAALMIWIIIVADEEELGPDCKCSADLWRV